MKVLILVFTIFNVALAKPGIFHGIPGQGAIVAPLAYTRVVPGAPIGLDGRVVDTPEVAVAKAEHAAAHVNEKVNLVNEAVKSADVVAYSAPAVVSAYAAPGVLPVYGSQLVYPGFVAAGAPIGADGRVVDTPEVAVAKAAHAAAHINEKVNLVNEAAKNNAVFATPIVSAYNAPIVTGIYPAVQNLAYNTVV